MSSNPPCPIEDGNLEFDEKVAKIFPTAIIRAYACEATMVNVGLGKRQGNTVSIMQHGYVQ